MTKAGLSNQLLGKTIFAKPEYGNCSTKDDVNGRIWAGLQPNLSGEWIAVIDAAWTSENTTKLAVHDVYGNTAEMYLTNVNLKQG